ncbi:MAG: hypothetical protein KAR20_26900, partial [Candidatus Heimdallarchaeota archaeon]|nr:hypothetical protein [Candidatus Heimdallarchaeota archaeon]
FTDLLSVMAEYDRKENFTDLFLINISDPIPGIEDEIISFSRRTEKPIVVGYMGGAAAEKEGAQKLNESLIPTYHIATRAAESAIELINYAEVRRKREKKNSL